MGRPPKDASEQESNYPARDEAIKAEKENKKEEFQITSEQFNKRVYIERDMARKAQKEYFKANEQVEIPIGGKLEKKIKAVLGKKVVKNLDDSILKIHKEVQKTGRFPEWVPNLICLDANPVELYSDEQFAQLYETEVPMIFYVRRHYPNYSVLVALKRKNYMADLGNYSMRILARRMETDTKAIQLGLEISGIYTPKLHEFIEEVPDEIKKQKISALLEKFKPQELKEEVSV